MTTTGADGASARDGETAKTKVLLLDDDAFVGKGLARLLALSGYDVCFMTEAASAVEEIVSKRFDVVLSDIMMPKMSGIAFLRAVRAHDLDVPVILMTGNPTVDTAIEAMSLGALHYLKKPIEKTELLRVVARAGKLGQLAQMKRDAMREVGTAATEAGDLAGLQAGFDRCLEGMWMAFQPIVDAAVPGLFGYEALLRSVEPSLPHPGAVLHAAERLNRVHDLGRRVRALTARAFAAAPSGPLLFVNLHSQDLLDPELYEDASPLAQIARRVVLEVTERASLDDVRDVAARVARLRSLGFRIAIDDLGAGYAGLSSFAALEPEFVKVDMSLVRDVHRSTIRQRLIGSITRLCNELGMRVLAEGIESAEERDALRAIGCDLLQGYYFAKPGRPFPDVVGVIHSDGRAPALT